MVNDAVDEVRREEQKSNKVLKKTRWLWLKNQGKLTKKEKDKIVPLKEMNLKTVRAYNIKLGLEDFWAIKDPEVAEKYIKEWHYWATHSKLKPMIKVAKTIKRHWRRIMNYINTRVTNGLIEGINGLIQSIKNAARGFRSLKYFTTMIYLRLGKLNFDNLFV
jgi:transposase